MFVSREMLISFVRFDDGRVVEVVWLIWSVVDVVSSNVVEVDDSGIGY